MNKATINNIFPANLIISSKNRVCMPSCCHGEEQHLAMLCNFNKSQDH